MLLLVVLVVAVLQRQQVACIRAKVALELDLRDIGR
jgi:hypothetical protein